MADDRGVKKPTATATSFSVDTLTTVPGVGSSYSLHLGQEDALQVIAAPDESCGWRACWIVVQEGQWAHWEAAEARRQNGSKATKERATMMG
jgi:hypothetical protein